VYFELEQAEVHFIPSGCYLVSYYDGGSLAFFSIIHPASLYGSVYVRCRPREGSSQPLLLLHEVELHFF
jgi:hypothetical protein